jgi:DNA primase
VSEDLKLLKERIYNEGTVGQLLEELGCDEIKLHSHRSGDDLVTARLPGSSNKRSVQVYLNPQLKSSIVNRGVEGNIYSIVGYILYGAKNFDEVRQNLYQIKTYICNALGYEDFLNRKFEKPQPKVDWNWWLRDIQKARSRNIEITENEVLDEIILNEFIPYPWIGWVKEGISVETQKKFGIGFHVLTDRVTIPVHNSKGQLIGVKGRYVGNDPEILEHKKYSYIYPCSKNIELFNLHRALPHIKEKKRVFVLEAAKSTMKMTEWGFPETVSIEGDRLSPVQTMILKQLGLDIDFIFCWDKGKTKEFVEGQIKQMKNRRVFYLFDNPEQIPGMDRYEDKESPTDKTIDVFLDLYKNGIYRFS